MEKVEVNKQIVLMRKTVLKAKVHILRKLIRLEKLYKNKRGSEQVQNKYHRKAERLLEDIKVIKKINPDDISKHALANMESTEELLKKKNLAPVERAFNRFCAHKSIQEAVEKFREIHPDWQAWMLPLLKLWKRRRELKKREQNHNSSSSSDKHGTELDLSENNSSQNPDKSDQEQEEEKVENDENKGAKEIDTKSGLQKAYNSTLALTKRNKGSNQRSKKVEVMSSKSEVDVPVEKREGTIEVKRLNLNQLADQNVIPTADDDSDMGGEESSVVGEEVVMIKDPFFVGGSDSHFEQLQQEIVSDDGKNNRNSNNFSTLKLRSQFVGTLSGRRQSAKKFDHSKRNDETQKDGYFRRGKWIPIHPRASGARNNPYEKFTKGSRMRQNIDNRNVTRTQDQETTELKQIALHPSWEAKRKLKTKETLHLFQGKKIVFD